MGRVALVIVFIFTVLAAYPAQSARAESGDQEMQEMDSSMAVQPGDTLNSVEEKGMDVQPNDSIDSVGDGAH